MSRRFGVDFAQSKDAVVPLGVRGSDGFVSLEDVRQQVLQGLSASDRAKVQEHEQVVDMSLVGPDLKVTCKFCGVCQSPSKKDPVKPKSWVCGSNFSQLDRRDACVQYRRLESGLPNGANARDRPRRRY